MGRRKLVKSFFKCFDKVLVDIDDWRPAFNEQEVLISGHNEVFDLILSANNKSIKSSAQLRQDVFVLFEKQFKRNGFFVEFGATNGIELSNSYLLEKEFGWTGILAEPAKMWHEDLIKNRKAAIEFDCVWRATGEELLFNMANEGELSTIDAFSDSDNHSKTRKSGEKYKVKTISLIDLLKKHDAPKHIDYLSIDTEGSEFEILNAFDFTQYKIDIITCEHNYTKAREEIYDLLTSKGYVRKFETISQFDDWYVLENH